MSVFREYTKEPADPIGLDQVSIWQRLFKKWAKQFFIRTVSGGRLVPDPNGGVHLIIDRALIPPAPQGSGWKWQKPNKELDPTVSVAGPSGDTYTAVYISPGNTLCTTGLVDLVSGELTKAPPGIWMAAKSVPAKVGGSYNVPQLPYPGANGSAPAGSPLAGDLDGANVFWIQLEAYDYCANQDV